MAVGKRDYGRQAEQIGIAVLLLLTAAGLWSEVIYNLAIMQGQLRWIAVMPLFAVALYGLPVGIAWIFTLRRKANAWNRRQVALFVLIWVALTLVPLAVSFDYGPFRVGFALQRASLESLARRVERGNVPALPLRLGLYTVDKVEKDSQGNAWLWMEPEGTHRRCVFVHCKAADLPPDTVLFPRGLTGNLELAPQWRYLWWDG